jgi:hypothetical protein
VQPKMNCLLEVMKQTLDRLPVKMGRLVHVLGKFVHCKCNVWLDDGKILESPYSTSI